MKKHRHRRTFLSLLFEVFQQGSPRTGRGSTNLTKKEKTCTKTTCKGTKNTQVKETWRELEVQRHPEHYQTYFLVGNTDGRGKNSWGWKTSEVRSFCTVSSEFEWGWKRNDSSGLWKHAWWHVLKCMKIFIREEITNTMVITGIYFRFSLGNVVHNFSYRSRCVIVDREIYRDWFISCIEFLSFNTYYFVKSMQPNFWEFFFMEYRTDHIGIFV